MTEYWKFVINFRKIGHFIGTFLANVDYFRKNSNLVFQSQIITNEVTCLKKTGQM